MELTQLQLTVEARKRRAKSMELAVCSVIKCGRPRSMAAFEAVAATGGPRGGRSEGLSQR